MGEEQEEEEEKGVGEEKKCGDCGSRCMPTNISFTVAQLPPTECAGWGDGGGDGERGGRDGRRRGFEK